MSRLALVLALFMASCGAEDLSCTAFKPGGNCGKGDYAFRSGNECGGAVAVFNRNFIAGATSLSTPADPPCAGDETCIAQCKAVGTTWTCVNSAGAAVPWTVNQGTGATSYTDPLGLNALDMTTSAKDPSFTGNAALNAFFASAHTIVYIGQANNSIAVASVEPVFSFVPTGCFAQWRAEEPVSKIYYGAAGGTTVSNPVSGQRGPSFGWGMASLTWSGSTVATRLMGATLSAALASEPCSSGGTLNIQDDGAGHPSGGSLQSMTFYNVDKTNSLAAWEASAGGLGVDTASPVVFVRDGQAFLPAATMGSREEAFAPGMPVVTARGIEIHSGGTLERPSANGWILDSINSGLPKNGLDASSWAEATATPSVVNVDVATGLFAAWAKNNLAATEMDEIVDASAVADVGKKGTLMCSDNHLSGAYTMGIVARTGTTGVTLNKMRMGIITDGTVGSPCTTWIRARDGASVTTLTSTPEFYLCNFAVTGTPTSIIGEVLVGTTAADTGSIIVEAPTCTAGSSNSWPRPHSVGSDGDHVTIPPTETQTWPTGGSTGLDIETVFTSDMFFPPAGNLNEPNNGSSYIGAYVFDSQQGADSLSHAAYMIFGSGDGSHPPSGEVPAGTLYLQVSTIPSNAGVDSAHCVGDLDGFTKAVAVNLGVTTVKPGDAFAFRMKITPRPAIGGYARGDLHVYFDACGTLSTCKATTERQVYAEDSTTLTTGITTGHWCTLNAKTTWGQANLGSRLNAGAWMDGAVSRLTVKEIR